MERNGRTWLGGTFAACGYLVVSVISSGVAGDWGLFFALSFLSSDERSGRVFVV